MADEPLDTGPSDEELASLPTVFRDGLFAGQVVLVSGGAGGIGRAISYLFGRLGATVAACGRDPAKLARLEAGLAGLGVKCSTHVMTIRDPAQVAALMDEIWRRHGRLDVLINNAGGQFPAPALEISPRGWQAVIDTNLTGTWYMTQEAGRRWIARGQPGVVVNIVVPVVRTHVGIAHSMAARAGQIALARNLAVEWAPYRIRLNCVALGVIASPGLARYPPAARATLTLNPLRRMGHVQDVAQACVYLAAPSGDFITGAVLTVDGGMEIWGEFWPLGRPAYFRPESDPGAR
jgi:citronellol/citronellal dehydrogenase